MSQSSRLSFESLYTCYDLTLSNVQVITLDSCEFAALLVRQTTLCVSDPFWHSTVIMAVSEVCFAPGLDLDSQFTRTCIGFMLALDPCVY